MILNRLTLAFTDHEENTEYSNQQAGHQKFAIFWFLAMQILLICQNIIFLFAQMKTGIPWWLLLLFIGIPFLEILIYSVYLKNHHEWNGIFISFESLAFIVLLTEITVVEILKSEAVSSILAINRLGFVQTGIIIGVIFALLAFCKIHFHIFIWFGLVGSIYALVRLIFAIPEGRPWLGVILLCVCWTFEFLHHRMEKLDFHEKYIQRKSLEQFKEIWFNVFPNPIFIFQRSPYERNKVEVHLKFKNRKFLDLSEKFGKNRDHSNQDIESINKSLNEVNLNPIKEAPSLNINFKLIDNSDTKNEKEKLLQKENVEHLLEYIGIHQIKNNDQCSIKWKEEEEYKFIHYSLICTPILWLGENAEIIIFEDITGFKELDEVKNKLIGSISTNLISPFENCISSIEKAKSSQHLQEMKPFQKSALYSAKGLQFILNDMKDLSAIVQNNVKLNISETNISQAIIEVQKPVKELIKFKGINFQRFTNSVREVVIKTDKMRFQQIIFNLIKNAVNSTKIGGEVVLAMNKKSLLNEQWIQIQVKDNGPGIPEESLPRLFTLFGEISRADKNLGHQWSEIGYQVSNKLAKLLNPNAEINGIRVKFQKLLNKKVQSEEAQGQNKFEFYLPINIEAQNLGRNTGTNPPEILLSPQSPEAVLNHLEKIKFSFNKRCLLIENDKEMLKTISRYLKEELVCDHAWTQEEALNLLEKTLQNNKNFDFILLEKKMMFYESRMLCLDINKLLKKMKKPKIPIVLISDSQIEPNQDLGVVICLVKPISLTDIKVVLSNLEGLFYQINK